MNNQNRAQDYHPAAHENPAGFLERFLAVILDGILVHLPTYLVLSFLLNLNDLFSDILLFLYALLLPVLWQGYTVGKKIMKIRIVKEDGTPVKIGTMLMRNVVGGLIYALTIGIGVIVSAFMIAFREDKRAIHDFIAGTIVTFHEPD
ncbi:RDD family protein [Sutcliffiella deserti]|uniref:RDD family protein n=1 Tax=Sutcliffiella deserti TaxID=2875501 RepID=UPI001CC1B2D9|nr:RDD family protein [Sutcliffiella deserti]